MSINNAKAREMRMVEREALPGIEKRSAGRAGHD